MAEAAPPRIIGYKRLVLQVYAGCVVGIAIMRDNDWTVLLVGIALLPFLAEWAYWTGVDTRPRPAGWNQLDETALQAREDWQVMLRRAFWVTLWVGFGGGELLGRAVAADQVVFARCGAILAAIGLLFGGIFATRGWVGAWVVRRAAERVRAEGRYPAA